MLQRHIFLVKNVYLTRKLITKRKLKILQQKVTEIKNSLNCKMNYIDYIHVSKAFMVFNNISKVNEIQGKELYNLLRRNMGKNSDKCQNLDKVEL